MSLNKETNDIEPQYSVLIKIICKFTYLVEYRVTKNNKIMIWSLCLMAYQPLLVI